MNVGDQVTWVHNSLIHGDVIDVSDFGSVGVRWMNGDIDFVDEDELRKGPYVNE